GSVQESGPDGGRNGFQRADDAGRVAGFGIHDHVTDVRQRLQILRGNVDAGLGENGVDGLEHARLVAVNVQYAPGRGVVGQGDLGEVDRSHGRAVVGVSHQFAGDITGDVFLSLAGRAANVRGQQNVVHAPQL